jgi:hypothetical protein
MICPRNFLRTADSDIIIVSLHLVIPVISMARTGAYLIIAPRHHLLGVYSQNIIKHVLMKVLEIVRMKILYEKNEKIFKIILFKNVTRLPFF